MAKRKKTNAVNERLDPRLYNAVEKLQTVSSNLSGAGTPQPIIDDLEEAIGMLETTNTALLEDSYSYCCELIDPHIFTSDGMSSITQGSLCTSVNESLAYLIEFWKANKDKEGVDLCL